MSDEDDYDGCDLFDSEKEEDEDGDLDENTRPVSVQAPRDQARKAKVQTELNLAREIKGNRNVFRCIRDKKVVKEDMGPLQKENGDLVMMDTEKAEVLHDYFASVFTGKGSSGTTQVPENTGGEWEKEDLPTVSEEQF